MTSVLTFADTGCGVATPRACSTCTQEPSDGGGSGLGLYISRELARSVGGDLHHVPTAFGAEFRVVVPLVRQAVRRPPMPADAPRPIRLLMVDDHALFRGARAPALVGP